MLKNVHIKGYKSSTDPEVELEPLVPGSSLDVKGLVSSKITDRKQAE